LEAATGDASSRVARRPEKKELQQKILQVEKAIDLDEQLSKKSVRQRKGPPGEPAGLSDLRRLAFLITACSQRENVL
jgi:hypothetical protein